MVLLKIMGVLDFLTGVFMILYELGLSTDRIIVSFIIYLVLKGVLFLGDFASFVDFSVSFYMALMLLSVSSTWVTVVLSLYLLQKGFFSVV